MASIHLNDTDLSRTLVANYLADLRNNRPSRPSGSRPLPAKSSTLPPQPPPPISQDPNANEPSGLDAESMTALPQIKDDDQPRTISSPFHRRAQSDVSKSFSVSSRTSIGRPLVRDVSQGSHSIRGRKVSPTATIQVQGDSVSPNRAYRESGTRWIERQEAIALRDALQEMDIRDEEKRIHEAAQNEAAELVWKHRNPHAAEEEKTAAYKNPDLANNRFKQHLEKGAHARSQSQSYGELAKRMPRSTSSRSVSDTSTSSNEPKQSCDSSDSARPRKESIEIGYSKVPSTRDNASSPRRRSGAGRVISSGSTKGLFRNPEDEIYEEPEQTDEHRGSPHVRFEAVAPLRATQRNSLPQGSRPLPAPDSNRKKFNPFEIHRNVPSKSLDAQYTTNTPSKPSTPDQSDGENVVNEGVEIRSDDIRAATSMRRKDRSPNLPTPTAVSDRAGRPIVSFDPKWRPSTETRQDVQPIRQDRNNIVPTINVSSEVAPAPPVIVLPEEHNKPATTGPVIPSINLPSQDAPTIVPSISLPGEVEDSTKSSAHSVRPLPDPSARSQGKQKTRLPWLHHNQTFASRAGVPTATCANCALPIAGRVVTASGSGSNSSQKVRFHPECFTCFHCSTSLEAAEFYPEPENKRLERLEQEGLTEQEERTDLRFYCHLDFHEFFSPRCRSCKTPIEGQVIIAAGAEWHVGHFFCAECGDVSMIFPISTKG